MRCAHGINYTLIIYTGTLTEEKHTTLDLLSHWGVIKLKWTAPTCIFKLNLMANQRKLFIHNGGMQILKIEANKLRPVAYPQ